MTSDTPTPNPLLADWCGPYGLPPFATVQPSHFLPAFDVALPAHLAEIDAIAHHLEPASFANTLQALDESGRLCSRIDLLFHNLTASETSPELQAVEREMAPRQAAHHNAIYMNAALFQRIDALHQQRGELPLDAEQLRLLARVHLDFVRAGAMLAPAARQRYGAVMQELASLCAQFGQNVLADEAGFALELHGEADLAGLPLSVRDAAQAAATQRGLPGERFVITLSPSLAEPFLAFSARRDLRETLWRARVARGAQAGARDNRPVAARIMALRQEQAALHGYASYADYELVDRMAGQPRAVIDLLTQVWEPAKAQANTDREALVVMARSLGEPEEIAAWDWRYLAQKVRQARYSLDDAEVKPYFALDNMITAMFDCAQRLFGIRFVEQFGHVLHHPDARLWEVRGPGDALVGLFIGDNYARATKRSGAWMSVFRSQSGHAGGTLPIVINNNNFAKATPTLLSFDDVRTLFHEFGHGLHGLLSQARFERLAGTAVLRDYVELPSQLFDNWAEEDEVLLCHARHHATHEAMPPMRPCQPACWPSSRRPAGLTKPGKPCSTWARHSSTWPCIRCPTARQWTLPSSRLCKTGCWACRPTLGSATICRIFSTCFQAPAMRPGTTFTCGPKCWRPMALMRSMKPATRLIPLPPSGCCAMCTAPATPASRRRRFGLFGGATPRWHQCSGKGVCYRLEALDLGWV